MGKKFNLKFTLTNEERRSNNEKILRFPGAFIVSIIWMGYYCQCLYLELVSAGVTAKTSRIIISIRINYLYTAGIGGFFAFISFSRILPDFVEN
jgi:hypothetical protein